MTATGSVPRRPSRVSVVIPCYNAERFIGETIESILAQTRPADEIIVADDCSTDRSREVVARYPVVQLLVQPENAGCASSRNLAISSATGDIIAIIDADDIWYPGHLAAAVGLLERFPECGFASSGIERFGDVSETRIPDAVPNQPLQLLDRLLHGNVIHQPTVVFRRALYDACGGFDASMRYCEDYDLWLRFALRSPGAFTGLATAGYRSHAGQLNRHMPQMFAATWYARLKLLDLARTTASPLADHIGDELGEVWVDGLYTAWAVRSRESLDFMLTLADRFPRRSAARTQWRSRRRFWALWVFMDRLAAWLPARIRRAMRPGWGSGRPGRPAI